MIRVTVDPRIPAVRARGHAGSAPAGHDLVCAGATVVLLTLERLAREQGGSGELMPGYARIWGTESCRREFLGLCRGLELLAQCFPDWVQYRQIGDREKENTLVN